VELAPVAVGNQPETPQQEETATAGQDKSACSLAGTVTDSTKAPIVNAKITITNVDTGVVRTLNTNGTGQYAANGLVAGNYSVKAEAPGFRTGEMTGIVLQVGDRVSAAELVLDVGSYAGCCEYAAFPLTVKANLREKEKPFTYFVGDAKDHGTLQGIAKLVYGDSKAWIQIFEANRNVVAKPGGISHGTSILIPPRKRAVPKLIYKVTPVYPPQAEKEHVWGDVVLDVALKEDGAVEQVSVIDGNPLLADAAMAAVKQWRYAPLFVGGKPVVKFVVVVSFQKGGKVR
jgi:TonB family protein